MSAAPKKGNANQMDETGGRGSFLEEALVHLVLVLATAAALYPVLWVCSLAFSSSQTPTARVLPLPEAPSLAQFRDVLGTHDAAGRWLFGWQLFNSLFVSILTAVVGVAIATPAAYALARFRFLGKDRGVWLLMATQMFPGVATLVPLYLILQGLHLLDSRAGLVLVYATTSVPFCVMQLRSSFESIPVDLEEAAMVDGASRFQAFRMVFLPLTRPGLIGAGTLVFILSLGFYVTPALLGGGKVLMIAEYVAVQINDTLRWGLGTMLATTLMLSVLAALWALSRVLDVKRLFGA